MQNKIAFFTSDSIAIPCLQKLNELYDLTVITRPDKPAGRKKILTANEIAVFCNDNNIKCIKAEKNIPQSLDKNYVLAFCFSYGVIIPKDVLDYFERIINLHPSKLPQYRGPSPIQTALLNNDPETALTYMQMAQEMDAGDIISQHQIQIDENDTYQTLEAKISQLAQSTIIEIAALSLEGKMEIVPQNNDLATYCQMIKKEDGLIDWFKTADSIYNQWRAYYCWPNIYTVWNDQKIILKEIKKIPSDNNVSPGTIVMVDNTLAIQTIEGFIAIEELQLAGKSSTPARDFLNGHPDFLKATLK
ncbi:MAG: methionyl-tRNA formyltransferase [Parcubacteria group bacterium CG1_02_37_51]|uniref:Methionyl-tRNA formyltransferase n=3 Tax=Candidatus Komeiliibacteriota TaxID=1817908 RepID=A0A2M7RCH4_9BACT|nr:MAG: methionyl-tRNA formyltransferase [Parcubacteria group bacterium CG1_02_37_51]PIY94297.1 MAG: methionyl-tRNA formyltransferase [Candidatus Komeilibacteria bacterium CG_4_10_14_0_8_um_filter_37_78]